MKERRKYTRVTLALPLECQSIDDEIRTYAVCKDISINGLRIINDRPWDKEKVLKLNIDTIKKSITCKGKVVWYNHYNNKYEIGIELKEINDKERKLLEELLSTVV